MVHHRVNAREQQRIDRRQRARVGAERRHADRAARRFFERQHVREDRLRADLPMTIESVYEAALGGLLHRELTEEQLAVAVEWLGVSARGHHTATPIHVVAS